MENNMELIRISTSENGNQVVSAKVEEIFQTGLRTV